MEHLLSLPSRIPEITACEFHLDAGRILLGHLNGAFQEWDINNKITLRSAKISDDKINSIKRSAGNNVVVCTHKGKVVVVPYDNFHERQVLHNETYYARSRVWRSLWVNDEKIITTSNYGLVRVYNKEEDGWTSSTTLSGHGSNAVFSIDKYDDHIVSTGDWFGNIILWMLNNGDLESIQKLQIMQAVEDIAWKGDNLFAVINKVGRIYLFEKSDEKEWNLVYEISHSSTMGKSIHITSDGKHVFGATETELIQFDRETHQYQEIGIADIIKITSKDDHLYVVTKRDIFKIKIEKVPIREDLISYKYLKISLIGHTGSGKSAFCSYVTTGSPGDAESTFGRTVWEWPEVDAGTEKRILFHDHGGQETAISTFLPFITDSDVILILFRQTDNHSLRVAYEIYDSIKEEIGESKKIFFVQTHTDHEMAELNDVRLKALLEEGKILDNVKLCPKNGDGIEEFKDLLLMDDFWNNSRTMIQTTYYDSVLKVIMELQKRKRSVFVLKEFNDLYEKISDEKNRVPENHLKYILNNYSDQGIIDYLPNLSDLIIVYDEDYNKLKSEIPIHVMKKSGIIKYNDLISEFGKEEYIKIIDGLYTTYNISIENYDQRIFPKFLKKEESNINEDLLNYIKQGINISLIFDDQKMDQFKILSMLSDMKGYCVDASTSDAIFTWTENVVLYYSFARIGNAIDGFIMKMNIRVGGKNEKIFNRSLDDFVNNLSSLFGEYRYEAEVENKKKVDEEDRNIIYNVALSFAGEQRTYVKEVANLIRSEGLVVFYDEFYEGKMWGEDLTEYLWRVYFKEASFCMMFISNDYVNKAWPTHEKRAAIGKEVNKMGGYILPVRFDYSEVPGLAPGIKHIKANILWPEEGDGKDPDELVSLFRDKITPS